MRRLTLGVLALVGLVVVGPVMGAIPDVGELGDGDLTLAYGADTGNFWLDNVANNIDTLFITSAGGLFIPGTDNYHIGDFVQVDANLYGAISFAYPLGSGILCKAQPGIPEDVLRADLTVTQIFPSGTPVDLAYGNRVEVDASFDEHDGSEDVLSIDFGTLALDAPVPSVPFAIWNVGLVDGNLDLVSISGTGDTDVLTTDLEPFVGLDRGLSRDFTATMATDTEGDFGATYTLESSWVFGSLDPLTLNLSGRVVADLTSVGSGNWNVAATWDDGLLTPTQDLPTVVRNHTVTLFGNGNAFSLLIDDSGGEVAVSPAGTLTVLNDVEVAAGTLEIRGTVNAGAVDVTAGTVDIALSGALNVGGDVTMGVSSEYVCELGASTSGVVTATGNVHLDGTLTLEAIDAGAPGPRFDQTIISSEGEILGQFAVEPTEHDPLMGRVGHLGLGVFHIGVNYVRSGPAPENPVKSVTVDLYVARGGDGNGDGRVDKVDITNLVANFGTKPDLNTWLDNDTAGGTTGRGDGKVDTLDITDLVANFGKVVTPDPGPAGPGEITMVPEPATVVMLAGGLLGLLLLMWRRRLVRRRGAGADKLPPGTRQAPGTRQIDIDRPQAGAGGGLKWVPVAA